MGMELSTNDDKLTQETAELEAAGWRAGAFEVIPPHRIDPETGEAMEHAAAYKVFTERKNKH